MLAALLLANCVTEVTATAAVFVLTTATDPHEQVYQKEFEADAR
jgi:hypothetical protein